MCVLYHPFLCTAGCSVPGEADEKSRITSCDTIASQSSSISRVCRFPACDSSHHFATPAGEFQFTSSAPFCAFPCLPVSLWVGFVCSPLCLLRKPGYMQQMALPQFAMQLVPQQESGRGCGHRTESLPEFGAPAPPGPTQPPTGPHLEAPRRRRRRRRVGGEAACAFAAKPQTQFGAASGHTHTFHFFCVQVGLGPRISVVR